jgi:hypothetical protein
MTEFGCVFHMTLFHMRNSTVLPVKWLRRAVAGRVVFGGMSYDRLFRLCLSLPSQTPPTHLLQHLLLSVCLVSVFFMIGSLCQ